MVRRQAGVAVSYVVATGEQPEYLHHDVFLDTETSAIPGTLLCPAGTERRHAAVLYCHAHGNRHDIGRRELLEGRPALSSPYGPVLAAAGFVVLCIDMLGFNERASEDSLSKVASWYGKPLFGRMLADLSAAFDYLSMRDDVDGDRVAILGVSMGATHAYWLAALKQPYRRRGASVCIRQPDTADWIRCSRPARPLHDDARTLATHRHG